MAIVRTVFNSWVDDDGSETTGTIWNKDAIDTGILDPVDTELDEIQAGGIAIASQAALDFIYASSGTQLARLAKGSGLQVVRLNAGATAYEFYTPTTGPVIGYAATLADVANTVSETTVLSFTVPANAWADGDRIDVSFTALTKNNSGADANVTAKVNAGAGAQVTLGTAVWGDNATEYGTLRNFTLTRVGADVWIWDGLAAGAVAGNAVAGVKAGLSTPTNFTSDCTVSLKITLAAASAAFYMKPQNARVRKYAAS